MGLRPPQRPDDILPTLTAELKAALGADLRGLLLFGSAAGERYRPGQSDLNLLILVREDAPAPLGRLIPWFRKWRRANLAVPLVATPDYLQRSRDVFPIEFLMMSREYRVLLGPDPLAELVPSRYHLRWQLERELKGKLMALRTRLLAGEGDKHALRDLVREALPALDALFKAVLFLLAGDFPRDPAAVLADLAARGIELGTFLRLFAVRAGGGTPEAGGLLALWEKAVAELDALAARVDAVVIDKET